jgi:4-alpha-glucanotransferase
MGELTHSSTTPQFPQGYRACGLLLHITSLPSAYGIGDVGPAALQWIDRLHDAGQSWWQALPLGPTGCHNSPYQCLSSFVGNGMLISPELLIREGLLREDDCTGAFSSLAVDYDAVIPFKHRLLESAWSQFRNGVRNDLKPAYEDFCHERADWLEDYALFRALKGKYHGAHYLEWPAELVQRVPSALAEARRSLAKEIDKIRLAQFLLFRQAAGLKKFARERGVWLIGDLPFFVSPDSSDVWANPELFLLDERRRPLFVGGVPPDYFSHTGQLWGNPVYDWQAHRDTGYSWWINRLRALLAHVDLIRLDHFRGFAAAWHVPPGSLTAEPGQWAPGPGAEFFSAVQRALGGLPFIAEDLGLITEDVVALREQFCIPGTRVLQFAFDGNRSNPHLPENYCENTVAYTATHDNSTSREWYEQLSKLERECFKSSMGRPESDARDAPLDLIHLAWSSRAALAITPLQDLLTLGADGRMNVPGKAEGNWRWRATEHMLSARAFDWLRELTNRTNRSVCVQSAVAELPV